MAEVDRIPAVLRRWLKEEIVGLGLCPYAPGPLAAGRVRIAVAPGDAEARLTAVYLEAERLLGTDGEEVETTLVAVPDAPRDFEDFADESALAVELVREAAGSALQVVLFHPDFRFDGADPLDPGNQVNRSPVPLWHLLRERSVRRVVEADRDAVAAVPARNRDLLRRLHRGPGEA